MSQGWQSLSSSSSSSVVNIRINLQHVAKCFSIFSTLQQVAAFRSILQHFVTLCSTLHNFAAFGIIWATVCNNLQHFAAFCTRLQRFATFCNILQQSATVCNSWQHFATLCNNICNTLQQRCNTFATVCNSLQHFATAGSILQHIATTLATLCNNFATVRSTWQHFATAWKRKYCIFKGGSIAGWGPRSKSCVFLQLGLGLAGALGAKVLYFYSWIDGWLRSKERKLGSKERKYCIFVAELGSGWGLGSESVVFSWVEWLRRLN